MQPLVFLRIFTNFWQWFKKTFGMKFHKICKSLLWIINFMNINSNFLTILILLRLCSFKRLMLHKNFANHRSFFSMSIWIAIKVNIYAILNNIIEASSTTSPCLRSKILIKSAVSTIPNNSAMTRLHCSVNLHRSGAFTFRTWNLSLIINNKNNRADNNERSEIFLPNTWTSAGDHYDSSW